MLRPLHTLVDCRGAARLAMTQRVRYRSRALSLHPPPCHCEERSNPCLYTRADDPPPSARLAHRHDHRRRTRLNAAWPSSMQTPAGCGLAGLAHRLQRPGPWFLHRGAILLGSRVVLIGLAAARRHAVAAPGRWRWRIQIGQRPQARPGPKHVGGVHFNLAGSIAAGCGQAAPRAQRQHPVPAGPTAWAAG